MKKVKIEPRYIVDSSGNKQEVILNIKTFEKIVELLEEMYLAHEALKALQEDEFVDFKRAYDSALKIDTLKT